MRNLIATLLVIVAVVPSALAQYENESSIRSADSIYRSPAWGRGSISGYPTDVVVIRDWHDRIVCLGLVLPLANGYRPLVGISPVINADYNSGGRITLRCDYSAFDYALIAGGTVELWSSWNGEYRLVDRDRLF